MAIRLTDEYPGRVVAPDANYPDGSVQNEVTPGTSNDGTPLDELWGNDIEGMKQRSFLMSGRTPSGSPDTSLASDIMDSMIDITAPFKVQPLSIAAMQVRVAPGSIGDTVKAEQTSSAITTPSVNPRIDVIAVSISDGLISIITGSESASPSAPAIPGDKRGIAEIALLVAQTSIVDSDITDTRPVIKGPSESDVTSITITPSADTAVTLTSAQYSKDRLILVDGAWTAGNDVIVPNESRRFYADNIAGSFDALVKTVAGAGVTVKAGDTTVLVCDSVNVLNPNTAGVKLSGDAVQVVNTQDGSVATGTTVLPVDNTIPQNSEGDEYLTIAITPTKSTNKLKIDVIMNLSHNTTTAIMAAALFQDSVVSAIAAFSTAKDAVADNTGAIAFTHYMDAGTTSITTFKMRAGNPGAGTTTFNGQAGVRNFGGVMASSITITEIEV